MDLTSAILLTLGENSVPLLRQTNNAFETLIFELLQQDNLLIKQYAFGLYGDVHKYMNDP
jgi:hypothetical protein